MYSCAERQHYSPLWTFIYHQWKNVLSIDKKTADLRYSWYLQCTYPDPDLSFYQSMYLSIYLSINISIYLEIYRRHRFGFSNERATIRPNAQEFSNPRLWMRIANCCLSICVSIIYLSIYLSIYLYIYLFQCFLFFSYIHTAKVSKNWTGIYRSF